MARASVLCPQVAVLCRAPPLVGALPGDEQSHVVQRVQPNYPPAGIAEHQSKPCRHQDFAEVVHVPGDSPRIRCREARSRPSLRIFGLTKPRNVRSGSILKKYFCMLAPRDRVQPTKKTAANTDKKPQGCAGIRQAGRHPEPHKVEVGVEGETAEAELEANSLGEDVVRVEVHSLKDEIVHDKPEEEDAVEEHSGGDARSEREDMVCREGQEVQRRA